MEEWKRGGVGGIRWISEGESERRWKQKWGDKSWIKKEMEVKRFVEVWSRWKRKWKKVEGSGRVETVGGGI